MPTSSHLLTGSVYEQPLGTLSADETFAGGEVITMSASEWPGTRDGLLCLRGDQVADQTITNGKIWIRAAGVLGNVAMLIGVIPSGAVVSTTKGIAVRCEHMGAFAELGAAIMLSGTITAGGLVAALYPLEENEP